MFVEHKVFIGLRDVAIDNKVTNTALLSYLEDAGGLHSNIVKFGLREIPQTHRSWVIIGWKIEIEKRPKYGEKVIVKTWCSGFDRLYAYRDFEILDENRNIIGKAASKWVLIDTEKGKITRVDESIGELYTIENVKAFPNEKLDKLEEPSSYLGENSFTVHRNLIDINNHLHNIYFMDIANMALPMEVFQKCEFNHIKMMYKTEIKLGDTVKAFYTEQDEEYRIVLKSEDEQKVYAIVNLKE